MLRAAEEEREAKAAAARAKRREEDRKRLDAEAKQRRELEAKVRTEEPFLFKDVSCGLVCEYMTCSGMSLTIWCIDA